MGMTVMATANNSTASLARSMEHGCSMSTISYVSMMLISANTLANILININNNNDDNNNNANNNNNNNDNNNNNQNGRAMFYQNFSDFRRKKSQTEVEKMIREDPFSHKLMVHLLRNNFDL